MSDQEPETTSEDVEMSSMFASVWVKVEVKEGDANADPEWELGADPSTAQNPLEKKQKPRKQLRSTKLLKCSLCEYTTVQKNCLKTHTEDTHFNIEPYSCDFCSYTTKYTTSLRRHLIVIHGVGTDKPKKDKATEMLSCDQCEYKNPFLWNLKAHERKHMSEKQFKCGLCPYETAYRNSFVKHCKVHKDYKAYKCDKCPFVTKFEGHIHRHLAKIHNEITDKAYLCDLCDFSTQVRWRLNVHKQRSKQEAVLKCPYCGFQTFYNCESKKHKTTHYSEIYAVRGLNNSKLPTEVNAMIVANQISKEDYNKTLVEENQAIVNVEHDGHSNNYILDPNCVDYKTIQVLESDDKERPFQCHMCSYTSKFKASVQKHFQRHHTGSYNRPYKCLNCDFSTKTKEQIALHNKRSASEMILLCPACDFRTFFKCQHIMHQKLHNPFKCTSCSYSCRQKIDLTNHYGTMHLGNGLKCQYCDYKSVRKESILCHETIHTGIKPYQCSFCDYTSVRKSLLNNHMKRYHSDVKKDVTVVSESKIESLKIPVSAELVDICDDQADVESNVLEYSPKEM